MKINDITQNCKNIAKICEQIVEDTVIYDGMMQYPLSEIFWDISMNEKRYKTHKSAQLYLLNKYNISSLHELYQIVDILGFGKSLQWDRIQLPAEDFEKLYHYMYEIHFSSYISENDFWNIIGAVGNMDIEKIYHDLQFFQVKFLFQTKEIIHTISR